MPTTRSLFALHVVLTLLFVVASPFTSAAYAADPPANTPADSSAAQDDDNPAALVLAEPDYRVINLPTTLRVPTFKGVFEMTHRFVGNIWGRDFGELAESMFGIDAGAMVGFEYRMGVAPALEAVVFRTQFDRTIQFTGKYDVIRQRGAMPVSISPIVSVEGTNNFREKFSPAVGASVSHLLGEVAALYAVPMWVGNTAASLGRDEDTFFFGVGGRLRIRPSVYVSAEVSPRLTGYGPGQALYGFAIEKRAGGHMFQLNFTNATATTTAQVARGGQSDSLALGFNLTRKFF